MIWLLSLAWTLALLVVVWVLFRAASVRPDERSLRFVAWGGLAAWIIYAILTLIDFGYVRENTGEIGQTAVIAALVGAVVLGYRWLLGRLRDRAQDP